MLIKGLSLLEIELKRVLSEKMPTDTRIKYLHTLKILIYLVVEFTNFCEKKEQSSKDNDLLTSSNKVF